MEAGFLNFHNEEQFSEFSLSLDHQHNLLCEPENSLDNMNNYDFDYVNSIKIESHETLWDVEQE